MGERERERERESETFKRIISSDCLQVISSYLNRKEVLLNLLLCSRTVNSLILSNTNFWASFANELADCEECIESFLRYRIGSKCASASQFWRHVCKILVGKRIARRQQQHFNFSMDLMIDSRLKVKDDHFYKNRHDRQKKKKSIRGAPLDDEGLLSLLDKFLGQEMSRHLIKSSLPIAHPLDFSCSHKTQQQQQWDAEYVPSPAETLRLTRQSICSIRFNLQIPRSSSSSSAGSGSGSQQTEQSPAPAPPPSDLNPTQSSSDGGPDIRAISCRPPWWPMLQANQAMVRSPWRRLLIVPFLPLPKDAVRSRRPDTGQKASESSCTVPAGQKGSGRPSCDRLDPGVGAPPRRRDGGSVHPIDSANVGESTELEEQHIDSFTIYCSKAHRCLFLPYPLLFDEHKHERNTHPLNPLLPLVKYLNPFNHMVHAHASKERNPALTTMLTCMLQSVGVSFPEPSQDSGHDTSCTDTDARRHTATVDRPLSWAGTGTGTGTRTGTGTGTGTSAGHGPDSCSPPYCVSAPDPAEKAHAQQWYFQVPGKANAHTVCMDYCYAAISQRRLLRRKRRHMRDISKVLWFVTSLSRLAVSGRQGNGPRARTRMVVVAVNFLFEEEGSGLGDDDDDDAALDGLAFETNLIEELDQLERKLCDGSQGADGLTRTLDVGSRVARVSMCSFLAEDISRAHPFFPLLQFQ